MKKSFLSRKRYWVIAVVVVLAVASFFVVKGINARKAASSAYQTQKIEKGDLTAIVGATGTVRANQSVNLTWQTSGRVSEIIDKTGDLVNAGESLATLAESSLPQSIILAQADLVNAQRNLDNLKNSNLGAAQAQLNLANAKDTYDRTSWNSLSTGTIRTVSQDQIDAAKSAVTIAQDKVDKAQKAYDRFVETPDSDPLKAGALSALANAKINLDNAKKNLNFYVVAPNTQEVTTSEAKLAVAKAQWEDAQREWDRLKDGPDPADISAAEARVAAIEATIEMAKITAPFAGTITDTQVMVGDIVNPGTYAFRIDDLSHMLVDVMVPEVDINRIKVGQDVSLTFDAISNKNYQGKVTEVARIGVTSAGAVNFQVTLEILNPDDEVLPGMTAAVNVVVSQLKEVVVIPNRAVRLLDGNQVIYLLKNGVPTKVQIVLGASSDTVSELVSGDVKPGDVIILNPSTDFSTFGGGRPPF
jgi:HlyD family secretion protein